MLLVACFRHCSAVVERCNANAQSPRALRREIRNRIHFTEHFRCREGRLAFLLPGQGFDPRG